MGVDPTLCEAADWPAEEYVGNERQAKHDHDELERLNPAEDDHFVEHFHYDPEHDDAQDAVPSLAQQRLALGGVVHDAPEVRRPAEARICDPVADRESRRHDGLQDEPEREGPVEAADQIRADFGNTWEV